MIDERDVLEKIHKIRGISEKSLNDLFRVPIKKYIKSLLLKNEIRLDRFGGFMITENGLTRLSTCEGCGCDPCDCDWGIS